MKLKAHIKHWFDSGTPFVWLNAGAVSISVIMVAGLIALIAVRGLGHFWPADIAVFDYYATPNTEAIKLMGEIVDEETVSRSRAGNPEYEGDTIKRDLIKTGNRDVSGLDFRWILNAGIKNISYPEEAMVVERREWGNFYGYLTDLEIDGKKIHYVKACYTTRLDVNIMWMFAIKL
jgi:phosphate transport system permease protein